MQSIRFLVALVVIMFVSMTTSAFRLPASKLTSRLSIMTRQAYTTAYSGTAGTDTFRINFSDAQGKTVSPWHDIPLRDPHNKDLFHFITEIPKNTKAKLEVSTKEPSNPIAQDLKKGKLRDYHGPIFWNYGCLPQTWENPNVVHPVINCKGDNDPVDVVEIGGTALPSGSVSKVKVLGVLAMIDDGELDWKVIAIKHDDPLAAQLHDIHDVETKCPGVVSGIREWFRWYKTPDNKPLNAFGFDEKALPKATALEVIEETHHYWKDLVAGKTEKGKLWLKHN